MRKTVPSFRLALEYEIDRWRGFRKALQSEEEKEAFDALMDMCRNYASESSNATNPVIFEPMIMSIMLAQQRKQLEGECALQEVLWRKICNQQPLIVGNEG